MKQTARIKRRTSPLAKLIRKVSSNGPMVFIDPMGDGALRKRLFNATLKAGRAEDFYRVTV